LTVRNMTASEAAARVANDLAARRDEILECIAAFVRIPSISAISPTSPAMHQALDFLRDRIAGSDLGNVQLLSAGSGHPTFYADWLGAPGAPTIMIYGHYDVQPAHRDDGWLSDPFMPEIRDDRIYGRGTSDVKGSTIIAFETVLAWLRVADGCPVNVKLFIEGEEEIGSPSLPTIVQQNRGLLAADAVLSADGGRALPGFPSLYVGARGLASLELTLTTASSDLHSGRFGGATRNAIAEMARLVSSLHHADGSIAVAGFEDDMTPISPDDIKQATAFPFDAAEHYAGFHGVEGGDPARTPWERMTLYPTIEPNGIWGGYTGLGVKTVIPAMAHAKLTMRLVAGQDPARARARVETHLRALLPEGVRLEVSHGGDARAFSLRLDHPLLLAAEEVVTLRRGRPPLRVRSGGTVPFTQIFQEVLGIDTLMFGLATGDENAHAPNEFFRLEALDEGLATWPALLAKVGQLSAEAF